MNRTIRWGIALVALPLAACAGNPPPAAPVVAAAPPPLGASDAAFINTAGTSDLGVLQEAQLAQKTSHNPKVVAFANKLMTDHTQLQDQLTKVATAKNVTLPTAPSDLATQQISTLQSLKGRRFDHEFIADQLSDHQQLLQAYQAEAQSGTDPDVKTFASSGVPVIQSHLDTANALSKPMATTHRAMRHHHAAS